MKLDVAAGIYAKVFNAQVDALRKIDRNLALISVKNNLVFLDNAGVKYREVPDGIEVFAAEENSRTAFYHLMIAVTEDFEGKFGINGVWNNIRAKIIGEYQQMQNQIREFGIEIPIARYNMTYTIQHNLIEFNANRFKQLDWYDGISTVTNKRIIFERMGKKDSIPLSMIATVGRELYYVVSSVRDKGIMRVMDFKPEGQGTGSIVMVCIENVMKDYINTVKVMRNEWKRLSGPERAVLSALYNDTEMESLPQVCRLRPEQVDYALKRFVELKYTDVRGRLISYGINIAEKIIREEYKRE